MAELEVIYDADKEVGAIINIDTRAALSLAMVGPQARDVLQAFIDATPFDITIMDGYVMREAFQSFLGLDSAAVEASAREAPDAPVELARDTGVEGAAGAEREAHEAAGEPPGPAPADADMEADEGPPTVQVRCWNCNGAGTIEFGDGAPGQTCNMCGGTGKVTTAVQP